MVYCRSGYPHPVQYGMQFFYPQTTFGKTGRGCVGRIKAYVIQISHPPNKADLQTSVYIQMHTYFLLSKDRPRNLGRKLFKNTTGWGSNSEPHLIVRHYRKAITCASLLTGMLPPSLLSVSDEILVTLQNAACASMSFAGKDSAIRGMNVNMLSLYFTDQVILLAFQWIKK